MKRVSDVGRWAVGPLGRRCVVALLAIILMAPVAKADGWRVTYKVAGDNSYNNSAQGGETWASEFNPDAQSGETEGNYWYGDTNTPLGVHFVFKDSSIPVDVHGHYAGLTSHIKGDVTVVLTWTGNDGNPSTANIPATASIKVAGHAHGVYAGRDGNSSVTLDVGKKGDPKGEPAPLGPDAWMNHKDLDETYLLTQAVSPGQSRVEFPPLHLQSEVASSAGDGAQSGEGGSHALGAYIEAVPDDRSVKLSRGVGDKEHSVLKDGSWVTYGDSRYSYLKRTLPNGATDYQDDPQPVNQTFTAVPEGNWSSETTFKWNPSGGGDTVTQHTQEMTQGGSVWNPEGIDQVWEAGSVDGVPHFGYESKKGAVPGGWHDAQHEGGTVKVFYKATDSDGATADASYVLTLHDEWENPTPDNTFFYTSPPNDTPHYGESLSGWRARYLSYVGGTTPSKKSEWEIDASADLKVELQAETSGNFGMADWLKFSGTATATTNLGVSLKYSLTPEDCYPEAPSTSSFQPIVRYKVKSKRIVLDHYSDSGRDVNPDRDNPPTAGPLAPPSDGKWPKKGEAELVDVQAYWLEVRGNQGPMTGPDQDIPDPTPTPTPARKSATGTSGPTITTPPTAPKPTPQPSGSFS